jgi:hypothetical protein
MTRGFAGLLSLWMLVVAGGKPALGQGTVFNYQGRLNDNGNPAIGNYDFRFALFDAGSGGNQVSNTNSVASVPVSNGLFSVTLNFGSAAFDGSSRWLEIAVRTNDSGADYVVLAPRQPLTPTPYAIFAGNAKLLGGQPTNAFAPAAGSSAYVAKSGDTMSGPLEVRSPLTVVNESLPGRTLSLEYGGDGIARLKSDGGGGSNSIAISKGGTDVLTIDSANRVGIGTVTPTDAFQISDGFVLHNGAHKIIGFGHSVEGDRVLATGYPAEIRLGIDTGRLLFRMSPTLRTRGQVLGGYSAMNEILTITKDSRVGIGTTEPTTKLEVVGTVKASAFVGDGSGLTGVGTTGGGPAGGDLTGTYPNPTIANSAVTSAKIASGQVVKSLNSFRDVVSITGGANISVATVGNAVQISSTGGATLTSLGVKSGTVWGATSSQYLTSNVAFGTAYPNTNYSIAITPRRASAGGVLLQPSATYTNKTATGFTVVIFASSTSPVTVSADWMTIPHSN